MSPSYVDGASASPIPVIDFGPFLKGSAEEKSKVAHQIDDAFHSVGFVYITNHGIAEEKVKECFDWVNCYD